MDRDQNVVDLQRQLERLGVMEDFEAALRDKMADDPDHFSLSYTRKFGPEYRDTINSSFQIDRTRDGEFKMTKYGMSGLKKIEIDPKLAVIYDTDELERRMKEKDWNQARYIPLEGYTENESLDDIKELNTVEKIVWDMDFLEASGQEGAELAEQLKAKYWLNTRFSERLNNKEELRLKFETRIILDKDVDPVFTIDQANNLFHGRSVLKRSPNGQEADVVNEQSIWFQIDNEGALTQIPEYPSFNMKEQISSLPIKEVLGIVSVGEIELYLEDGDQYKATYYQNHREESVLLVAAPRTNEVLMRFEGDSENQFHEFRNPESEHQFLPSVSSLLSVVETKELDETIINHGFDRNILPGLHDKINQGSANFDLYDRGRMNGTDFEATLHFTSDKNGKPVFESYQLSLMNKDREDSPFTQSFEIGENFDVNLVEAFNLMQGRLVLKDHISNKGEKYWIGLDPYTHYPDGNYELKREIFGGRFNVREVLDKYDVPNLEYSEIRNRIAQSLEMGSILPVSIYCGWRDDYLISANIPLRGLNIRDKNGLLVPPDTMMSANKTSLDDRKTKKGLPFDMPAANDEDSSRRKMGR